MVYRRRRNKVGINTAAVNNPKIFKDNFLSFGNQLGCSNNRCKKKLVKIIGKFLLRSREKTGKNAVDWAKEANSLGIKILLRQLIKMGR